ncbi:MAG: hypothetical protein PUP92_34905 [Rhizonema sp. PD38]|nr:hypothetical protein [Rhizonema sp. PD38]
MIDVLFAVLTFFVTVNAILTRPEGLPQIYLYQGQHLARKSAGKITVTIIPYCINRVQAIIIFTSLWDTYTDLSGKNHSDSYYLYSVLSLL